jgi:hypothetical protein
MKKNIIIILLVIIAIALYLDLKGDKVFKQNEIEIPVATTTTTVIEAPVLTEDYYMDISIYIQDKDIAKVSDCSVTKKIEYSIPKTPAVADASLKILFADELSKYGVYKSVNIINGVANVTLASDMDPSGKPISSLSSCESGHLLSALNDTLIQYESIKSVKLFSPKGEIVF